MSRESASQAIRQIRTLHALGAIGGLADAQLVERFLKSDGDDREDAFAALVQRHGPMVLGVCRRMLRGSADVDDAFQAVFLVLARKARRLRNVDRLKPWLYGVAVRTAQTARRRSARRQKREGGAMDESRAALVREKERSELLDMLDEEITRLPRRYREAVLLCELQGASREAAARQLRLPAGTLSSRLARGRTMLRERLTRRGVTLGAGALAAIAADPANAALPEALTHATVQLALRYAAGGTVPAAVSSLAKGVIAMTAASRFKLVLITAVALGAGTGLGAGLTWGLVGKRVEQRADELVPPATALTVPRTKATETPREISVFGVEARGVVVDETGNPVDLAEVQAGPFQPWESHAATTADGSFSVHVLHGHVDGLPLLAGLAGSDRIGFFQYGYNLSREAARAPVRIVLKPSKEIEVRVTDSSKAPVEGAAVQAAGNFAVFDYRKTGPDGTARLHVPIDARVQWIYAFKSDMGFDYAEFGETVAHRQTEGAASATLPGRVDLRLDGVRTARIKAVDAGGRPMPGVGFFIWLVHKEGRRSEINVPSRILAKTTGLDGIATFDWLPPSKDLLQFWPVDPNFARRRVIVEEGQTEPVTVRPFRKEAIRGRVILPDGSPAPDIDVQAHGSGRGLDHGQDQTHAADDGSYELRVSPGEAYAVSIIDKNWAAPSHLDVIVREGKPVNGVDFKLTRGTRIRGTVTIGPHRRPAASHCIRLDEAGSEAPEEFRDPHDHSSHQVRRQFSVLTDESGHYAIRVGSGTYTLMGPPRTKSEKITITNEAELVRDFNMPRPEKGMNEETAPAPAERRL